MSGFTQRLLAQFTGEDVELIERFSFHMKAMEDAGYYPPAAEMPPREVVRAFLRWVFPDQPDSEIESAVDDLIALAEKQARKLLD